MTVERTPRASARIARRLALCALLLFAQLPAALAQTLPPGSPVLLTEGTGATTRGVAHESVTFSPEPFAVVSPMNWNADKSSRDRQTRVTLFAMNLALLPGDCGRDEAQQSALGRLVSTFFGGSPVRAATALLQSTELSAQELAELEELLKNARGGKG